MLVVWTCAALGLCVVALAAATILRTGHPAVRPHETGARAPSPEAETTADPQTGLPDVAPTKAAWEAIVAISLNVRSLKSDPLAYWEKNYLLYGQIPLDGVDEELQKWIEDWMDVSTKSYDWHVAYRNQQKEMAEIVQKAEQFGGQFGTMAGGDSPQQGAATGGFLFGTAARTAAATQMKEYEDSVAPERDALAARVSECEQRVEDLRQSLIRKYGVQFRRRP